MQSVNFFEAMIVTAVSVFVVFIVLVIISYAIGILKRFSHKEKQEKVDVDTMAESKKNEEKIKEDMSIEKNREENLKSDEELVAVIASVIAANMGLDIPDIKIQKIRRVDNSVWNATARLEQIN